MTTFHTTQRDAKTSSNCVLAVEYCFLQHALAGESRDAYNTGRDGWNFDLFTLSHDYGIVTGYRSMSRAATHEVNDYPELRAELKAFDDECRGLRYADRAGLKDKLIAILDKHLKEAKAA